MHASRGIAAAPHGLQRWYAGQVDGTDTVVGPSTTPSPRFAEAAAVSASKTSSGLSASICAWGRHDSVRGRWPARGGSADVRYVGDVSKSGCDRRVAGDVRSAIASASWC